jgi:hypothetical protein
MKKRYNDGGLPDYEREPDEQDRKIQEGAMAEYNDRKEKEAVMAKPLAKASFKEAFAEARAAGDKTFEYMGKKYTTELAPSKPKAEPKAAPKAAPKAETKTTSGLTNREKEIKASGMSGKFVKGAAPDERRAPTTSSLSKEERIRAASGGGKYVQGATPMRAGGKVSSASKRGDGCAQRGKTRGRMV